MSQNCMALHDQGSWGRLAGVPTRQKERSTVTVQSVSAPLSWHATRPHNLRNLLIEMHAFVLHGTRMGGTPWLVTMTSSHQRQIHTCAPGGEQGRRRSTAVQCFKCCLGKGMASNYPLGRSKQGLRQKLPTSQPPPSHLLAMLVLFLL